MWQYLLNLWATPPVNLELACPVSPSGAATNVTGYFDNASVVDGYTLAAAASAAVIALGVCACYLLTRKTLGPGFKTRWLVFLIGSGLLSGVAAFFVLQNAPTHALAGTCESNPAPFAVALPMSKIMIRSVAGAVWGWLAFILLAWACTFTIGRWAGLHNGFFHNRGWPWPRSMTVK